MPNESLNVRVSWIPRWIRDHDLQVTSRERNPQFCGSPTQLRERSFYQLSETGTTWSKQRSMQNRLCWYMTGISWEIDWRRGRGGANNAKSSLLVYEWSQLGNRVEEREKGSK